MTAVQMDMITKIRSLKIMFSDAGYDKIPDEAKNLVQSMTRKLIETLHSSAIFFDENKDMWRTTITITEGGSVKRKHFNAKTEESLYNKLYDYYIGPGSLADIHSLWTEQRKQENLAATTLKRE